MRKTTLLAFSALSLAMSASAYAASPIDGTWKADIKSTQLEEKPIVIELRNGMYECRSCVPTPVKVKADGEYHAVKGQPYYDMLAVKVVDGQTIKTMSQKAGKMVSESTTWVSDDGKTATYSWSNMAPDGSSQTGKAWRKRAAAAPAGAHQASGSWMTTGYDNVSDNATTITYKLDGDMLHMTDPTGGSYAAKLGGPEVPLRGDQGGTKIKVRKINDSTFEETEMRGGKVTGVTTIWVDPAGQKLKAVFENKMRGSKMTYWANKQ